MKPVEVPKHCYNGHEMTEANTRITGLKSHARWACRKCFKDYSEQARRRRGMKKRATYEERFWAKVDKTVTCWIWIGCLDDGYGAFDDGKGNKCGAHRASYLLLVGPIPEGLSVLHRCDNPPCVNPGHLFLGTQLDNVRDMISKGRWRRWG